MAATALLVALAVAAAFYLGAFAYLGVTFFLMRGHTEPRSRLATARSFLFELLCVVIVQPLLPFFYVVGRRMGGGSGVPIVFVHGYFQNRVDFLYLARAFRRAGLGPLFGFNYPFLASVEENARRLGRFCAEVRAETGATEVDLVCHSLGGLVALEHVRQDAAAHAAGDAAHVRRCVTVAAPHAGVMFRGPILGASGRDLRRGSELLRTHEAWRAGVPVLSIFSSHDNVVHPKLTSALAARGGEDIEVAHFGHFGILFSRTVARNIATFLGASRAAAEASVRVEEAGGVAEGGGVSVRVEEAGGVANAEGTAGGGVAAAEGTAGGDVAEAGEEPAKNGVDDGGEPALIGVAEAGEAKR